ncbi:MAG: hypothetical protein Q8R79_06335 [Legionellaceae bacterium]|nr:hypothetical protein [Legionellaceae bacterium]
MPFNEQGRRPNQILMSQSEPSAPSAQREIAVQKIQRRLALTVAAPVRNNSSLSASELGLVAWDLKTTEEIVPLRSPLTPPHDPKERQMWEKRQALREKYLQQPIKVDTPIQRISQRSPEQDMDDRIKQQERVIDAQVSADNVYTLILFMMKEAEKNISFVYEIQKSKRVKLEGELRRLRNDRPISAWPSLEERKPSIVDNLLNRWTLLRKKPQLSEPKSVAEDNTLKEQELERQLLRITNPDFTSEVEKLLTYAMASCKKQQKETFAETIREYQGLAAESMQIKLYVDQSRFEALKEFIFKNEDEKEITHLLTVLFKYCEEANKSVLNEYRELSAAQALMKYYLESAQKEALCAFMFKLVSKAEGRFATALLYDKYQPSVLKEYQNVSWNIAFVRHQVDVENQTRLRDFIFRVEVDIPALLEEAIAYCRKQKKDTLISKYSGLPWRTALIHYLVDTSRYSVLSTHLSKQSNSEILPGLLKALAIYCVQEKKLFILDQLPGQYMGAVCKQEVIAYYVDNNLSGELKQFTFVDVTQAQYLFSVALETCGAKSKNALLEGYHTLDWMQAVVHYQIDSVNCIDDQFILDHMSDVWEYTVQHAALRKKSSLLEPLVLRFMDTFWATDRSFVPNCDFFEKWLGTLPCIEAEAQEIQNIFQSSGVRQFISHSDDRVNVSVYTLIRTFHSNICHEISGLLVNMMTPPSEYKPEMYAAFITRCRKHIKKLEVDDCHPWPSIHRGRLVLSTYLDGIENILNAENNQNNEPLVLAM